MTNCNCHTTQQRRRLQKKNHRRLYWLPGCCGAGCCGAGGCPGCGAKGAGGCRGCYAGPHSVAEHPCLACHVPSSSGQNGRSGRNTPTPYMYFPCVGQGWLIGMDLNSKIPFAGRSTAAHLSPEAMAASMQPPVPVVQRSEVEIEQRARTLSMCCTARAARGV